MPNLLNFSILPALRDDVRRDCDLIPQKRVSSLSESNYGKLWACAAQASRFWGDFLMRLKSTAACAAAILFCVVATGCHLGGGNGGCAAGPMGCDSNGGGCSSGSCGGLAGIIGGCLGGGSGGGCLGGDPSNCVTPESLAGDGYGVRGGFTGPLAGHLGQHHRGPQSHMGPVGPADGPPIGQTTYPYYTTRGPRDYFAARPASIGP